MTKGFVAAGLTNILGILLFTRGLNHPYFMSLYPEVFSLVGCLAVMLWGLAYLSVARAYRAVPVLVWVFALEKGLYFVTWIMWLIARGSQLPAIWAQDPLSGIFYTSYGVLDLSFGFFFAIAANRALSERQD